MTLARLGLVTLVAALALSAPAFAGNVIVTVGLKAGQLSLSAPASSTATGKTVAIPVTVTDARGSGAGWSLHVDSSKPVTVTSITARCAANSTCTLPKASGPAQGGTILHVAPNTGMGVIQLVVTVAASSGDGVPVSFSVA